MSNEPEHHGDFDEEMADYLQTFLDETEEQLDDLVETMLSLEDAADNEEDLNEAFRLIHSIKGSAGMMGLDNITVLTHHLENRFERFRSGTEALDEATMNLVLRCIDFLRQCTHRLRDQEKLGSPAELLEELRRLEAMSEQSQQNAESQRNAQSQSGDDSPPISETQRHEDGQESELLAATLTDADSSKAEVVDRPPADDAVCLVVTFRPNLPLVDLKAQLILSRITGLGELKSTLPEASLLPEIEQLDRFEIWLETEVDSDRLRAAVDVDGVESIEVSGASSRETGSGEDEQSLVADQAEAKSTEAGGVSESTAAESQLESPTDSVTEPTELSAADTTDAVDANLPDEPRSDTAEKNADAVVSVEAEGQDDPIGDVVNPGKETSAAPPVSGDPAFVHDAEVSPVDEAPEALASGSEQVDESSPASQPLPPQLAEKERVAPTASKSDGASGAGERASSKIAETMRVDIDRLDHLMNLAGELVINRARFVQIAGQISPAMRHSRRQNRVREFCNDLRDVLRSLEKDSDNKTDRVKLVQQLREGLDLMDEHAEVLERDRQCVDKMDDAIDQLSLVSQSLQQGVLDTRMIPVGPLFNRFKRVVRDMSKDRGKRVDLQIRGEKTELDKRMIDELGDPLVHLVRNSIDHGLESPEAREALGKPAEGTIVLEATHSGNNVYIHVRDDGGGIDVEKIKKKLIANGVLSSSAASELTDSQALDYIWHPGFSTASEVTDISGRGVGMDVVQNRIRQLNGSIEIESEPQRGTHFTIRLPLTLAIINCLLVRLNGIVFSMPIDSVREIVSVAPEDIVRIQGKETFDVRDEFMPLVGILDVFDWNQGMISAIEAGQVNDESALATDGLEFGDEGTSGEEASADFAEPNVDVVVLQSGGKTMGLKVDELLGSQDMVIKSLSDNFIEIRGLSGASILGDGSVCLMLDVATAFRLASGYAASEARETGTEQTDVG